MSETPSKKTAASDDEGAVVAPEPGLVSQWLSKQGFDHNSLEPDHLGVCLLYTSDAADEV